MSDKCNLYIECIGKKRMCAPGGRELDIYLDLPAINIFENEMDAYLASRGYYLRIV